MRRSIAAAVIVIASLVPPRLVAQDGSSAAVARCSFDTAAHLRPDSVIITLAPGSRINNKPELDAEYRAAADAIHQYYLAPPQVGMPLWARAAGDSLRPPPDATSDAPYGLDGEIRFRLDATGRLTNDSIAVETLVADLAESVVAAIRRADSAGAFAPPSSALRQDHGMVRLHFATTRTLYGATLLRVIVPTLRVDQAPRMERSPPINYPDDLRRAGITGRVLVQFVVGADGRAVLPTLSVVRGEYAGLVTAVIHAVPSWRFTPAKIEQCDVPVLIRAPVDFNIRY
jgi:TonB family protein